MALQTQPDLLVCEVCGSREFTSVFGLAILNGAPVEHRIVACATCSRRYQVVTEPDRLSRLKKVPADVA